MSITLSRRCFVTIAAAAAGLPLLLKVGGAQLRAQPDGVASTVEA